MMSNMFLENLRKFFNNDIDIIEYENIPDEIGGHYKEIKEITRISGLIRPLDGNEVISADKLTVTSTHVLYCEVEDIEESKYIKYRDKEYDVLYVQNVMNFDDMLQVNLRLIE